jgi:hypothetical protein
MLYAKCDNYKKNEEIDLCMKTHCKECRNYSKCFAEENKER